MWRHNVADNGCKIFVVFLTQYLISLSEVTINVDVLICIILTRDFTVLENRQVARNFSILWSSMFKKKKLYFEVTFILCAISCRVGIQVSHSMEYGWDTLLQLLHFPSTLLMILKILVSNLSLSSILMYTVIL